MASLYARLLTEGKRNGTGGGLSAQTVRNVHITIQGALSDAERKGTVVRNVGDLADAPHHQPQQPNHERVDQRRAALLPGGHLRPLPVSAVPACRDHRHAPSRDRRAGMAQRRPRHSPDHRQPAVAVGRVQAHRKRPQDPHQPPNHRPRPPHRHTTAPPPAPPTRRSHGHRPPPQRRLRLRQTRRMAHPPPTSSARPSNASSPSSTCPASAYTTCATPTPRSCCNKASTPKSSANASATPASHSPWTSTNTSYPACKPKQPPPSEPPSSATPRRLLSNSGRGARDRVGGCGRIGGMQGTEKPDRELVGRVGAVRGSGARGVGVSVLGRAPAEAVR